MSEYKKTIAVDFDGVIHKYSKGWQNGEIYDEPVEGSLSALVELYNKGYKVVIFTTREDINLVHIWIEEQCDKYFLEVRELDFEVTNKKPPAIAYIDDRGIRFTNWKDMMNYF